MTILAGDIGGTTSRLGLFDAQHGARQPLDVGERHTPDAPDAATLVVDFLAGRTVQGVCLGVAGAVIDGHAQGSNLPWTVSERALSDAVGVPVVLINDLEATAHGTLDLQPQDTVELLAGERRREGPIGIVAPGTGMGQAMLVYAAGSYRPVASEAGHIDFAPGDPLQADYWRFLHERHGHVSLERACSGSAIPHLFEFLVRGAHATPAPGVDTDMAAAAEPGRMILRAGLEGTCPACVLTVDTLVRMLGAAAGNLALQIVATGGIYLAGGISPRLLPALRGDRFAEAFTSKGRFSSLMRRIPVSVVVETRCGLFGAARAGLSAPLLAGGS